MNKSIGNKINNTLLDIVGWAMVVMSLVKIWKLTGQVHISELIPWIVLAIFGVGFVAFTIKDVATKGWDWLTKYINKKFGSNEE